MINKRGTKNLGGSVWMGYMGRGSKQQCCCCTVPILAHSPLLFLHFFTQPLVCFLDFRGGRCYQWSLQNGLLGKAISVSFHCLVEVLQGHLVDDRALDNTRRDYTVFTLNFCFLRGKNIIGFFRNSYSHGTLRKANELLPPTRTAS